MLHGAFNVFSYYNAKQWDDGIAYHIGIDEGLIKQLKRESIVYVMGLNSSRSVCKFKKCDKTGEDLENLISIETIGLIKVIESFSPNKGTKLAMFAAHCGYYPSP